MARVAWGRVPRVLAPVAAFAIFSSGACRSAADGVRVQLPTHTTHQTVDALQPVVLEFGSYSCPFSALFRTKVLPKLDSTYFQPGRVLYRYVDVSETDDVALPAIEHCVAKAIGNARAHQVMFENNSLDTSSGAFPRIPGYRDTILLNACVTSANTKELVIQERLAANKLRVVATPTFVVGYYLADGSIVGWPLVGISRPDSLKKLIEAALKESARARMGEYE